MRKPKLDLEANLARCSVEARETISAAFLLATLIAELDIPPGVDPIVHIRHCVDFKAHVDLTLAAIDAQLDDRLLASMVATSAPSVPKPKRRRAERAAQAIMIVGAPPPVEEDP